MTYYKRNDYHYDIIPSSLTVRTQVSKEIHHV